MSENDKLTTSIAEEDAKLLEWTTHPMRRKPLVSVVVTMFILLVSFVIFYSTDSRVFSLLALIVLFASLTKFYLPTKYTFTEKQIFVKTTTQTVKRNWSQYRSCYPDKNGVLLSPFLHASRLENFRGLYLIFADNEEAVMAFTKAHLATTPAPDSATENEAT